MTTHHTPRPVKAVADADADPWAPAAPGPATIPPPPAPHETAMLAAVVPGTPPAGLPVAPAATAPAPVPVVLDKTPVDGDDQADEAAAPARGVGSVLRDHVDQVKAGARTAPGTVRSWLLAESVTEEQLAEKAAGRQAAARAAKLAQAKAAAADSAAEDARRGGGESERTRDARAELARARAAAQDTAETDAPSPAAVAAERWRLRAARMSMVGAGAWGGVYMGMSSPGMLLATVPVAWGGAWLAGRGAAQAGGDTPFRHADGDVRVVAEPTAPPADQAVWVTEALAKHGITDAKVLTVSHRPWGQVVEVELLQGTKALAKALPGVTASMRLPTGALSFTVDENDSAIASLQIIRKDPFASLGAPPHAKPCSRTVNRPLPVGMEMNGSAFELSLCRTHSALIGGTGSGKSSALWTEIDALSSCEDVVLLGIDLTGAPALKAWGDVIQWLATEEDEAEALLDQVIAWARGRAAELGEKSRPRLGQPLPDLDSENWKPTPEAPQIVLIIDEYPALVEARLWGKVATILKIARKAAITLILASQKATQAELGSTTVKAQIGLMSLLSCDEYDVQQAFGSGKRALGWTPDLLRPSNGVISYDAGVSYTAGGTHTRPERKKFYRLELGDVHRRALERMEAGLPRIDAATLAHKPPKKSKNGTGGEFDGEFEDALEEEPGEPLAPEQRALLDAVRDAIGSEDRAHNRVLAERLAAADPDRYGGWTAAQVGAALREAQVTVTRQVRIGTTVTAGVHLDAITARLASADRAENA